MNQNLLKIILKKTFTKGVNINYFSVSNDVVNLRTYERGVEDETLSCGTGAVALAVCLEINSKIKNDKVLIYTKGGELKVSLKKIESTYSEIWLSGGVEQVYSGEYNLDI
jgi:diaminopimelate epimerase